NDLLDRIAVLGDQFCPDAFVLKHRLATPEGLEDTVRMSLNFDDSQQGHLRLATASDGRPQPYRPVGLLRTIAANQHIHAVFFISHDDLLTGREASDPPRSKEAG